MATRFDPKEYSRQRFVSLCARFLPKDHVKINVGRKGFRLADSMTYLIEQAKGIVMRAQTSGEVIPDSTATVFRFGIILQEIFLNVGDYLTVSQLKSWSRRGHRKELEITEFDLKKVELALKRSPEPPVKAQKDDKLVMGVQRTYQRLLREKKYQFILEDSTSKQNLFVLDDSAGNKFFKAVNRLISRLKKINQEKKQLSEKLLVMQEEIIELKNRLTQAQALRPQLKRQLEDFRRERGVFEHLDEKEGLLATPQLSLFLKVITNSLERYVKWVERREHRIVEHKDAFMGLVLEPSRFKGFNEELWREIVFIIENYGMDLLQNKDWFEFNQPGELREFITRIDILELFARLREIETQLDDIDNQLQQDPRYVAVTQELQDNDHQITLLDRLQQEIPETTERLAMLSREMTEGEEEISKLLV